MKFNKDKFPKTYQVTTYKADMSGRRTEPKPSGFYNVEVENVGEEITFFESFDDGSADVTQIKL